MLTVTGLTNAEYLISSVALSIDEYYAGVGESPGVWAGRWAEGLGLAGVVEADELRALVEGKHPVTGEDLLAGSRPRSVRAFDLTFSAPKSVSLLWALGSEPVAEVVAAAHREAVEAAFGFLEERAAVARVQSEGVRRRVATEGWVVAGFVHRTSREGDPQLHTHCLVPNLVRRTGTAGMWRSTPARCSSGPGRPGRSTRTSCSGALSLRLGVSWGPDRRNTRDIDGFTRAQLRAFSKRTAQIEAELEAKGAVYESPALRMQADDEASLATRTGKDHSLTPSLLAGRWQSGGGRGRAGGRRRSGAGGVLRRPGPGGAGLGGDQPGAGRSRGRAVRPRRPGSPSADVVEHICALSGGRLDRRRDHRHGRPVPGLRSGGAPDPR